MELKKITIWFFFRPEASKILFENIGWGHTTEFNTKEQGGILVGKVHKDEPKDVLWADVMNVIPANNIESSSIFLKTTHESWKSMHNTLEKYISSNNLEDVNILGYYHTHPNNLSTEFSTIDIETQKKHFNTQYSFCAVFNPHKKEWSAYHGKESDKINGYIINTHKQNMKNYKTSIRLQNSMFLDNKDSHIGSLYTKLSYYGYAEKMYKYSIQNSHNKYNINTVNMDNYACYLGYKLNESIKEAFGTSPFICFVGKYKIKYIRNNKVNISIQIKNIAVLTRLKKRRNQAILIYSDQNTKSAEMQVEALTKGDLLIVINKKKNEIIFHLK